MKNTVSLRILRCLVVVLTLVLLLVVPANALDDGQPGNTANGNHKSTSNEIKFYSGSWILEVPAGTTVTLYWEDMEWKYCDHYSSLFLHASQKVELPNGTVTYSGRASVKDGSLSWFYSWCFDQTENTTVTEAVNVTFDPCGGTLSWEYMQELYDLTDSSKHTYVYPLEHGWFVFPGQPYILGVGDGISPLTDLLMLPRPERDGYTFLGWYTAPDGGTQVFNSDPVERTESHTLYAHWEKTAVSGKCGDHLTWSYSKDTNTLTISGTGEMYSYSYDDPAPWKDVGDDMNVVIENGVTDIGDFAFGLCKMSHVTIPQSVTKLGDGAFMFCSLESIVIPSSVTRIGSGAFSDSSELQSVTFLGGLSTIGAYAFAGCHALRSVTLPNSVSVIEISAFGFCDSLSDVYYTGSQDEWNAISVDLSYNYSLWHATIHYNSDGIAREAAALAVGSTDFVIENGVLTEYKGPGGNVVISEGVTRIGSNAFSSCTSLTSVTIPDGVKEIGDAAFSCCSSLRRVTIPKSVTKFGNYMFTCCDALESVTIGNGAASLGMRTFEDCTSLKDITIPDGVTSLIETFWGCTGLKSVTIPKSVTMIADYTFDSRSNLSDVFYAGNKTQWGEIDIGRFNEGLTKATLHFLENEAQSRKDGGAKNGSLNDASGSCGEGLTWTFFKDTGTLTISGSGTMKDFTLLGEGEDKYTSAPWSAYRDAIKSIVLDGASSIGACAFSGCGITAALTLPDTVTVIGDSAFSYCNDLTAAWLPDGVTLLGKRVFYHCNSLTSVSLPASVSEIGSEAFGNCRVLAVLQVAPDNPDFQSVDNVLFSRSGDTLLCCPNGWEGSYAIPEGTATVGSYAFARCDGLTGITIPTSVTDIGDYAFMYCRNLNHVTILQGLTKIGDAAFAYCTALTGLSLPAGVTKIGDRAFYDCNHLAEITLPTSITDIGVKSFHGCDGLSDVYYCGTQTQWNAIAIDKTNDSLLTATIRFHQIQQGGKDGKEENGSLIIGGKDADVGAETQPQSKDTDAKKGISRPLQIKIAIALAIVGIIIVIAIIILPERRRKDRVSSAVDASAKESSTTDQTENPSITARFCPYCGSSVLAFSKYCAKCGKQLSNANTLFLQKSDDPEAEEKTPEQQSDNAVAEAEEKNTLLTAESQNITARFCPYCGSAIMDNAQFCMKCGKPLNIDDVMTQNPQYP